MSGLHRFSRTEILIGADGLHRLACSSVAVIGIGGVGSYAVEALCRAGVGRLTLVDFDDICLTNVNRQLHAMDGTVGRSKVLVMAERCRLINPKAEIVMHRDFYSAENSDFLLSGGYDYVVDAIDHITSKIHLLKRCHEMRLSVVSSMGAANKIDPSKIAITDISKTHICGMARIVRKLLRKQGVMHGIKVVYSTEEFSGLAMESALCKENCICPNKEEQRFSCEHRRNILGSISYLPAIFGLTIAGVVVNDLLKK